MGHSVQSNGSSRAVALARYIHCNIKRKLIAQQLETIHFGLYMDTVVNISMFKCYCEGRKM